MTDAEILERELLKECFGWPRHNTNNKHALNFVSAWILDKDQNGSLVIRKSDTHDVVKIEPLPILKVDQWKMIYKKV
jgi:hypothetical protein